jgi:membrane protein involved in colicin uptake
MTDPSKYQELVAKAEGAVQAVKDPELRRVAFEKVLDDLLGRTGSGAAGDAKGAARKAPVARPATGRKAPRPAGGPKGYVKEMIEDGFFKKPNTIAQVKAELENRGHHIPFTSLSGPLQSLCQERELRRQKTRVGKKQTYSYSEW